MTGASLQVVLMCAEEQDPGGRPRREPKSRWLLRNTVRVCLPPGETFYDSRAHDRPALTNKYSLFAGTVRRRRARELSGESPPQRRRRREEVHRQVLNQVLMHGTVRWQSCNAIVLRSSSEPDSIEHYSKRVGNGQEQSRAVNRRSCPHGAEGGPPAAGVPGAARRAPEARPGS